MVYKTIKGILCRETNEIIRLGDIVTIITKNGRGYGGCKIVKIIDGGFHFDQGRSGKSIQYKNVREIRSARTIAINEVRKLSIRILLEKALNRLVIKARIRNAAPDSIKSVELNAMVNLLEAMGFDLDLEWETIDNKRQIVAVNGGYDGEVIHKIVKIGDCD